LESRTLSELWKIWLHQHMCRQISPLHLWWTGVQNPGVSFKWWFYSRCSAWKGAKLRSWLHKWHMLCENIRRKDDCKENLGHPFASQHQDMDQINLLKEITSVVNQVSRYGTWTCHDLFLFQWIRCVHASHLLLICTNLGYGAVLTEACARPGCSASRYYYSSGFATSTCISPPVIYVCLLLLLLCPWFSKF
jgi:hypothetical protein